MNMKLFRGLIDAGLTDEQIEQVLTAIGDAPVVPVEHAEDPQPVKIEEVKQTAQAGQVPPAVQPQLQPTAEEQAGKIKDILDNSFNEFIQKFQGMNIMQSQQPQRETAEDILASIINPKPNN